MYAFVNDKDNLCFGKYMDFLGLKYLHSSLAPDVQHSSLELARRQYAPVRSFKNMPRSETSLLNSSTNIFKCLKRLSFVFGTTSYLHSPFESKLFEGPLQRSILSLIRSMKLFTKSHAQPLVCRRVVFRGAFQTIAKHGSQYLFKL